MKPPANLIFLVCTIGGNNVCLLLEAQCVCSFHLLNRCLQSSGQL